MSRRRYLVFAAPLVVTAVFGCDKKSDEKKAEKPEPPPPNAVMTRNPPMPLPDAAVLPTAPAGTAVLQHGDSCRMFGGAPVACPPNIAAPAETQRQGDGNLRISFEYNRFGCQSWEDIQCPTGATCNPPPPRPVPCPEEMLPTLVPGAEPTAKKDGDCFVGEVEVRCP